MMSWRLVSSPARVEKYPPPLMRFLRSSSSGGGGSRSRSRSRGRSRSSPLFVRRSKSSSSAAVVAAATQEPSSPKVTCMGQVRVRRSKPQTGPGSHENSTRRCKWIRNALIRRSFAGKLKSWSFNRNCSKWVSLSFPRFRRKSKREENSRGDGPGSRVDTDSIRENGREVQDGEEEWGNYRNPRKLFVSPVSTPPRNALFLTRSQSAPYRSSSLAFKFWESDNQNITEEAEEEIQDGESISRISESDTAIAGKCEENEEKCENEEEDNGEVKKVGHVRTPVLGRSKSGPARIGERMLLNEEAG